jgi:hypothetical protein
MSWLVPAAGPVRDRLAGVIAGLAAEHGAPVFAPHVTMADVAEAEPDAAARVLERVVAGVPPFEVALPVTIRVDAAEVWADFRDEVTRWRRVARVVLTG